jgi:hypothetical protein
MIERLFSNLVCSDIQRIDEHIKKHRLNVSREKYLSIAEEISKGREGLHEGVIVSGTSSFIPYTIVIKGIVEINDRRFGIVRSVRRDGRQESVTCVIHGNFPYSHGFCPICDLQLNSESRR